MGCESSVKFTNSQISVELSAGFSVTGICHGVLFSSMPIDWLHQVEFFIERQTPRLDRLIFRQPHEG